MSKLADLKALLTKELGELVELLEFEEKEGYVSVKTKHYIKSKTDWQQIQDTITGEPLHGATEVGERGKWYWNIVDENIPKPTPPPSIEVVSDAPRKERETSETKKQIVISPMIEVYDQEILDQLKRSKEQQSYLQTVKKDQHGKILSGKHRKKVDSEWPEEIVEVKDELDREVKIIHFNVQRRVPMEETQLRIFRIIEILKSRGTPDEEVFPHLVKLLPYTPRHLRTFLPAKYKMTEKTHLFVPKVFTVWNFSNCDPRFGTPNFPGRVPGQIVQNTLYYFTNEGDFVVDPLAGSGTTNDVCQLMNRKCVSYDIAPIRDFIRKHNIKEGFPHEAKGCNLIFLDPPYWKMQRGQGHDGKYVKESVSSASKDEFLSFMAKLAKDCFEVLNQGGYVALLLEDFYNYKDPMNDSCLLPYECYTLFIQVGFKPVCRIQVPLTTQQYGGAMIQKTRERHFMLNIARDLLIFRKG